MSQVIEILTSLGINQTVFMQFGVFFVAYIAMSRIAFKPYLEKHNERLRRTVGSQEEAESLISLAEEREAAYKLEARKLNSEIRSIFSNASSRAKQESETLLREAQELAEKEAQKAQKQLEQAIKETREELERHIPEISTNIQNKFVRH